MTLVNIRGCQMSLCQRLSDWVKKFDSVSSYTYGPWQYHQFYSSVPFRDGSYFPDGRFVFHRLPQQIPEVEQALISQVRERKLRVFKYAKKSLPGEEPAVIVYATKKDRGKVQSLLESLSIIDYEWREGNPTMFDILEVSTPAP